MTADLRHVRRFIVVVLLCWGSLALRAQQPTLPAAPLTVDDAVAFALEHNPSQTLAVQGVQVAEDQLRSARSNGLPDVTAGINATYTPTPVTANFQGENIQIGKAVNAGGQVSVAQPVWPTTIWRAPVQSAKAGVALSKESLERTRQQIAYQTRAAYYQVQTAQDLVQVAKQSEEVAQAQLKLAQNTVDAGLAAPLDVYQAKAVLADAQVGRVKAQNGLDVAKAALVAQLGLPAGTAIEIAAPKELGATPDNVDALVAAAVKNRPEFAQLEARRQQLKAAIELIRLQKQPVVSMTANYNQPIVGGSLFGSEGLTFGAVASIKLFDGGQANADLAAAKVQLQQVDTSAQQLTLGVGLEVRQAWLDLRNAVEQLTAAEQQRAAAAEALRISQLRYENGEGIVLEVEQARLKLTQALTAQAQAHSQANLAAARLAFAIAAPATMPLADALAPAPAQ